MQLANEQHSVGRYITVTVGTIFHINVYESNMKKRIIKQEVQKKTKWNKREQEKLKEGKEKIQNAELEEEEEEGVK